MIPALSQEEYQNLEQSILAEGCRDSLIIWNGILIDGHNRFEICNKHRVPFATKEQNFDSKNDVCIWMIKNQFGRRNLSLFTRGELGLRLGDYLSKKGKENLKLAAELTNSKKQDIIKKTGCQRIDTTPL